jgi:hypothetical protein
MLDAEFSEVLSGKMRPPYLWSLMAAENRSYSGESHIAQYLRTTSPTNKSSIYYGKSESDILANKSAEYALDNYGFSERDILANKSAEYTLDNYSFSIGVWCMEQALKHGTPFRTNEFHKGGWFTPGGINHGEILHAARHEAMTNGWPKFNNQEGFRGDE